MAGSRLERYGTIFSRVKGLLKSGAMHEDSKPLWFDVYQAFPPRVEPNAMRPVPNNTLIHIVYPEDIIRARFYKTYGSPGLIDMTTQISKYKNLSQIFIEKYIEIARRNNNLSDDELFNATEQELNSQGFSLKS